MRDREEVGGAAAQCGVNRAGRGSFRALSLALAVLSERKGGEGGESVAAAVVLSRLHTSTPPPSSSLLSPPLLLAHPPDSARPHNPTRARVGSPVRPACLASALLSFDRQREGREPLELGALARDTLHAPRYTPRPVMSAAATLSSSASSSVSLP